jgi:hypothetical protein
MFYNRHTDRAADPGKTTPESPNGTKWNTIWKFVALGAKSVADSHVKREGSGFYGNEWNISSPTNPPLS